MSAGKIKDALDEARRQLPAKGRGVIFLRMPRHWMGENFLNTPSADVARGVLRTRRACRAS